MSGPTIPGAPAHGRRSAAPCALGVAGSVQLAFADGVTRYPVAGTGIRRLLPGDPLGHDTDGMSPFTCARRKATTCRFKVKSTCVYAAYNSATSWCSRVHSARHASCCGQSGHSNRLPSTPVVFEKTGSVRWARVVAQAGVRDPYASSIAGCAKFCDTRVLPNGLLISTVHRGF